MTGDSITQLFGIPGFRISSGEPLFVDGESDRPYVMVEMFREKKEYRCSCGRTFDHYEDGDDRSVRDLSFGEWDVYLIFFQVRVNCPACGIQTEALDWLRPFQRQTIRFENLVARLCEITSLSAVARLMDLDWKTVKRIDKWALEKKWNPPKFDDLRILAVDEIAIKKGHQYATVILDFEKKRVVWVEEGRKEESLTRFYERIGSERCDRIEAIAMDMWKPYMKATKKCCPKAEIVFDKFHIIAHMGKVIDEVRNQQYKKASRKHQEVLKGIKYLLLQKRKNVRGNRRVRLSEVLAINKPLNTVHLLREDLKQLWEYQYPGAALNFFQDWYRMAMYSKIEPLKKFARMLKRHWDGIVAHCQYKIHTSLLEGINNKAKVIKRVAYGYHDSDYFFLKLRAAFPGVQS